MSVSIPKYQIIMRDDGCPPALFMTAARRAKAWAEHPPRPMPLYVDKPRGEDAATVAFRAQVEAERRQKSLNSIAKMKTKFASKAIDYDKMRWDPRRSKFVEDVCSRNEVDNRSAGVGRKPAPTKSPPRAVVVKDASPSPGINPETAATLDWSRSNLNSGSAQRIAKLNGVWDDKYEKLGGGLLTMTILNRLNGLVKKGGTVRWS